MLGLLAYYQYNDLQLADSSKNEATPETCGHKPTVLHPDKDNDSENRDIDRQAEGAGQQMECAQRGGQSTRHPEAGKSESNQKMEASKPETGATETAKKGLEEKGDGMNFSEFLPMKNPRGEGLIEPIDKGWEIVDRPINLVSQLALSSCQHKLTNETQGVPPSDRSSSRVDVEDPQPKSLLSHIKEDIKGVVRIIAQTGRPDPIALAHGAPAKYPSSSKHVAAGGSPKRTDSEVGVAYTFASQILTTTVLS